MRIISKFTDYYDTVQQYGQDDEIIYVRNKLYPNEYFKFTNHTLTDFFCVITPSLTGNYKKNVSISNYDHFILGYCGNLYRGFIIEEQIKNFQDPITEYTSKYVVCYNQEQFRPYEYIKEKQKEKKRYLSFREKESKTNLFEIYNYAPLKEIFFKYRVPTFLISSGKLRHGYKSNSMEQYKTNLTLNPSLKKYQFYKMKDAFSTFQDIAMFMGGVLGFPGNAIIELNDKERIIKHGFDKWSFRKQSEKKK